MSNFSSIKTRILTLFFLAIMLYGLEGLLYAENNEEKYNPHPIVFVHGYNVLPDKASKSDLWKKTSKELQKYFFVDPDDPYNSEYKYHNERLYNYEAVFDYREMSEGDIGDIATNLANYVDEIIKRLPVYQKKQVIIVAHSMGGLVTRRMLSMDDENGKSYQEKVAKVIFVDSPLLGSPLASGVILIDRLMPDLEQKKQDYSKYADADVSLYTSPSALAYYDLYNQINDHLKFCEIFVNWNVLVSVRDMLSGYDNPYRSPGQPRGRYIPIMPHYEGQKVAIGELVVPATTEASKIFIGNAKIRDSMFGGIVICSTEPVRVESNYGKSETFLNNKASVLAIPNNFRTIQGSGEKSWFRGKAGSAVFKLFADYSGLPDGNKLEDLDIGDGIVTPSSQTALARNQSEPNNQIYHIEAFHTDAPNAWETILKAVDDEPPAVESIRVISADRTKNGIGYSVFVIAKVKEYLLADIRFSYLTIDEQQVDLGEFYEMGNDYEELPFKPYIKFTKDFLKKRQDPNITNNAGTPQTLYPGEFYVKLDTEGNEAHIVKLKMKNAAGKESDEKTFKFQRPIIDNESPTGTVTDNPRPTIQARIHSPLGVNIDLNSLQMTLDGVDVPFDITEMGFDITLKYVPENDLDWGLYTVAVNAEDINGLPAEQKQWTFNVSAGSDAYLLVYTASGINQYPYIVWWFPPSASTLPFALLRKDIDDADYIEVQIDPNKLSKIVRPDYIYYSYQDFSTERGKLYLYKVLCKNVQGEVIFESDPDWIPIPKIIDIDPSISTLTDPRMHNGELWAIDGGEYGGDAIRIDIKTGLVTYRAELVQPAGDHFYSICPYGGEFLVFSRRYWLFGEPSNYGCISRFSLSGEFIEYLEATRERSADGNLTVVGSKVLYTTGNFQFGVHVATLQKIVWGGDPPYSIVKAWNMVEDYPLQLAPDFTSPYWMIPNIISDGYIWGFGRIENHKYVLGVSNDFINFTITDVFDMSTKTARGSSYSSSRIYGGIVGVTYDDIIGIDYDIYGTAKKIIKYNRNKLRKIILKTQGKNMP